MLVNWILNRRYYIALGIVAIVTLVLFKLPSKAAKNLKLAIGGTFLAAHGVQASARQITEKAANKVVSRDDLVQQIKDLDTENKQLKLRLSQADELARENARLRQALGFAKQNPGKFKPARIVAHDPANWWRNIRIDVGSRDGITPNLPVQTADGLVGRISEVGFTQSQVVLLGDPDCRVAVMIEDTRENGVIAPASASPLDSTLVDLGYLSRNSKLAPGQRVITSGIGGVFPKGILVGQIVDWKSIGYGLYTEARVKLQVNMNTLEEVWVRLPQ
jgi:rod shape-determining protein MreC